MIAKVPQGIELRYQLHSNGLGEPEESRGIMLGSRLDSTCV